MNTKSLLGILAATAWIGISEFVRNQLLFNKLWVEHYKKLGIVFPSTPTHGAVWGIWSLAFAILIYFLVQKYSLLQTTILAWLAGFVMMWLVIGNLNVLPYKLLWFAVPLSLLEAFVAAWILLKLTGHSHD